MWPGGVSESLCFGYWLWLRLGCFLILRPRGFSGRNVLDLTLWPIDWAGSLKRKNRKDINGTEFKCWSLDFTGASGEIWLPMRMKISAEIDIAVHELHF